MAEVRRRAPRLGGAAPWPVLAGIAGVLVLLAALLAAIVYLPQRAIDPRGLSRQDAYQAE